MLFERVDVLVIPESSVEEEVNGRIERPTTKCRLAAAVVNAVLVEVVVKARASKFLTEPDREGKEKITTCAITIADEIVWIRNNFI